MKKLLSALILSLVLTPLVHAKLQDANPQGKLGVRIAVADSPDYISEWVSTDYSHDVYIKSLREVVPEQTAHLAVVVTGYGIDDSNHTDLTADFVLQNPDGTIQFKEKGMFKHKRDMGRQDHVGFVMLDPALDLVLEESDQSGEYKIVILVHDGVTGKGAMGEYSLTLKKE